MIPKETIDLIFETARIDEVVGDFVQLKKRGVNMLGNCPFHDEKTPSFTVSPAKGIYKCFGCGKGGNSVNFVMDHEHFSYPEALKYLANKYNIFIEETVRTPEQEEAANERESMFIVSNLANEYFQDQLFNSSEGKAIGLSYFKERGYREDILKKFQLGYSPEKSDAFSSYALDEGYKIEFLEKTGLSIPKEAKNYDRFRGRVMFPIHSLSGRVLGFGGRILKSNVKAAKYLNSPESDIYHKSKVLYGMYYAKNSIVKKDRCLLVEGYTDVISMHQAGIENVVASSGTSLTVEQIKLIKRFTNNITLLFDGDAAGLKAALRGVNLILEEGLNVKVVTFPEGEDPDSYSKKVSSEELELYIEKEAKDFIAFKSSLLLEDAKEDPAKRTALIKDIASTIALIPDTISRTVYAQSSSQLLGVEEQLILTSIEQARSTKAGHTPAKEMEVVFSSPKKNTEPQELHLNISESDLLKYMIKYSTENISVNINDNTLEVNIIDYIQDSLSVKLENGFEWLTNPILLKLYDEILILHQENIDILETLTRSKDPDITKVVVELIFEKHTLSNWGKKEIYVPSELDKLDLLIPESLLRIMGKRITSKIIKTQEQLKSGTQKENEKTIIKLMDLTKANNQIKKKLGREC